MVQKFGAKISQEKAREYFDNWLGGGHNLTSYTFDISNLIDYLTKARDEEGADNVIVFFGRKKPEKGPPEETVFFAPAIGNPTLLKTDPYNEGGGGNLTYYLGSE